MLIQQKCKINLKHVNAHWKLRVKIKEQLCIEYYTLLTGVEGYMDYVKPGGRMTKVAFLLEGPP